MQRKISIIILFTILYSFAFAQLEKQADSIFNLLNKTKDTTQKVSLLNELCWKYRNFNPDTAVYFGEFSIELSKGSKEIKDVINAYGYTGVAYRNKGIYSKSLELYYKGAELAEKNKEYQLLSYAFVNIANVHIYRNDFQNALIFLNKANRNSILVNDDLQKSYIYVNLGRVYTELRNNERAHYYIDRSIELRKKLNDEERIAVSYKYKGDLLVTEDKKNDALYYYHEALKICEKSNEDKDLIADVLHKIASIYISDGNYYEAERYALKSLSISDEIGAKYRVKDANYALAYIYSVLRLYKKAYSHYVAYSDTKDSIFSKESNRLITNLQTDFAIEKQQKENEILRTKQAIDREIIKKRELMIISISIGLFLMLVIVFILYNSNKQKKNANTILVQKNAEISEQKEKIEEIARELEKVNKTKDRFFSIIAHDLKNPFNTLIGFSSLLKSNIDYFDKEKLVQIATTINDTSNRTYNLLENLLDWSRSQTNTIHFEPEHIHLNLLVMDTINLLKSQAEKKNVELINKLDQDLHVFADFNMVNTVLRNLISNALKFTENGSVAVSCQMNQTFCSISIEDTGIGISPDSLEKLFRIDKSISTTGTKGEIGTGIGLILCKEFVLRNKGTIFVESQVKKGSKFTFTLPLFSEENE